MYCTETKVNSKLYAYKKSTDQAENNSDMKELYSIAAKDKGAKLVVFGGLHGYDPSGEPTGQTLSEKKDICNFSMEDRDAKSVGKGINFIYCNIAKYTTDGSDVTKEKQKEIATLIKGYLNGGYYVLLSWCFSYTWAKTMKL